jgi:high potential iron-sulfur protein
MNRRTLLQGLAATAAVVSSLWSRRSESAELPHLDVKDPAAVAVGYVENADQVDAKKYPVYVKGSSCENCLLLQGAAGPAYRPCGLFAGKSVAVRGWCSGWSAEI